MNEWRKEGRKNERKVRYLSNALCDSWVEGNEGSGGVFIEGPQGQHFERSLNLYYASQSTAENIRLRSESWESMEKVRGEGVNQWL